MCVPASARDLDCQGAVASATYLQSRPVLAMTLQPRSWTAVKHLQIFSQPPAATVGVSEDEAIASFSGRFDIYISKFKPMRATLSGRDERTLIKLVVDSATDLVIGAHMVGPDAPEIMQVRLTSRFWIIPRAPNPDRRQTTLGVCLRERAATDVSFADK